MRVCVAVVLGLFAVGSSQPVNDQPILKDVPNEVLFRTQEPFVVECAPEPGSGKFKKYSWLKNGQPFEVSDRPDVVQRHNEGSLVFLRPADSDEGDYRCLAESQYGVASTRDVRVRRTFIDISRYEVQKHKPVEGRTFKLACPAPNAYPKPNIEWKSQQLADTTVSDDIRDPRITIGPDGSLYFANVTEEDVSDRFKYVCVATSSAVDKPVVLAEHFISSMEVDRQPKHNEVVEQYVSPDTTALVGERIYLYCIYGGTPLAHPDWFKENKDVNNEPGARVTRYNRSVGKRLLIKEVLPEDDGNYTCTVDNEVGKKQKHSMKLTVVGSPKFTKTPEKIIHVKEGDDITVPCLVSGIPTPKLSYMYSATPLKNSRVTENRGLLIKKVQKSDSGYYGCNATNEYGSEYYETLLLVA
ncbi:hemolin [Plodia interpunctella]|uniref:hemolin n=1 Tax=Plodia interpunctella TaxID=58824 RepID=UPI0023678392|nr:hemolin-like [Plodia interpunctella]